MAIIIELFEAAAAAALLTSTATIRRGRQKNEGGKVAGRWREGAGSFAVFFSPTKQS